MQAARRPDTSRPSLCPGCAVHRAGTVQRDLNGFKAERGKQRFEAPAFGLRPVQIVRPELEPGRFRPDPAYPEAGVSPCRDCVLPGFDRRKRFPVQRRSGRNPACETGRRREVPDRQLPLPRQITDRLLRQLFTLTALNLCF